MCDGSTTWFSSFYCLFLKWGVECIWFLNSTLKKINLKTLSTLNCIPNHLFNKHFNIGKPPNLFNKFLKCLNHNDMRQRALIVLSPYKDLSSSVMWIKLILFFIVRISIYLHIKIFPHKLTSNPLSIVFYNPPKGWGQKKKDQPT